MEELKLACENIEDINELAERYETLNSDEQDAVMAVIESAGYSLEEALDLVESENYTLYSDCYTLEELAKTLFDDGIFGDKKEMGILVNYIDFESLGNDLGLDGYTETSRGIIIID